MKSTQLRSSRTAFTLVEVLVAFAMTMVLMLVITSAFQSGLRAIGDLKAIGDMQEKLRQAGTVLRRDLATPHFDGTFQPDINGPYLSDQRLDSDSWTPPAQGFFRIWQGSPVDVLPAYRTEGVDAEGIPEYIATNHMLHFTVHRRGNRDHQLFSTLLQPEDQAAIGFAGTYSPRAFYLGGANYLSDWAEVAYFLQPTVDPVTGQPVTTTGANPLQLYSLHRRARLLLPMDWEERLSEASGQLPPLPKPSFSNALSPVSPTWEEFSYRPGDGEANRPVDITIPDRRLQPTSISPSGSYPPLGLTNPNYRGDDILLTDVISFHIQVTGVPRYATGSPPQPGELPWHNNDPALFWPRLSSRTYPFDDLPPNTNPKYSSVRVFDTWSNRQDDVYNYTDWNGQLGTDLTGETHIPLRVRITAVKITIRIWDSKIEQARQITIVQDL